MVTKSKALSAMVQDVSNAFSKRSHKPQQVIDDLIQLSCNLITESVFITKAFRNTLFAYSPGFRNELTHYKTEPKAWKLLQDLHLEYMKTILENEPFADIVGMMYDETLSGSRLGQFLTPPDVADGLLPFVIGAIMEPINEKTTIGDICGCGAGSLILGQIKAIYKNQGKDSVKNLLVVANDIDMKMVQMTTAQIVLSSCIHRIPLGGLTAYNCNTITQYQEMNQGLHKAFAWIPEAPTVLYLEAIREKAMHDSQMVKNVSKKHEINDLNVACA